MGLAQERKKRSNNLRKQAARLRKQIYERDAHTCAYCKVQYHSLYLTIDHIHPLSKGGDNNLQNLITCCKKCNRSKSNKKWNT